MLPSSELRPLSRPRSLSTPRREDLLAAFRASERVALGCVGADLAATVLGEILSEDAKSQAVVDRYLKDLETSEKAAK
jgi:hypothetical protein